MTWTLGTNCEIMLWHPEVNDGEPWGFLLHNKDKETDPELNAEFGDDISIQIMLASEDGETVMDRSIYYDILLMDGDDRSEEEDREKLLEYMKQYKGLAIITREGTYAGLDVEGHSMTETQYDLFSMAAIRMGSEKAVFLPADNEQFLESEWGGITTVINEIGFDEYEDAVLVHAAYNQDRWKIAIPGQGEANPKNIFVSKNVTGPSEEIEVNLKVDPTGIVIESTEEKIILEIKDNEDNIAAKIEYSCPDTSTMRFRAGARLEGGAVSWTSDIDIEYAGKPEGDLMLDVKLQLKASTGQGADDGEITLTVEGEEEGAADLDIWGEVGAIVFETIMIGMIDGDNSRGGAIAFTYLDYAVEIEGATTIIFDGTEMSYSSTPKWEDEENNAYWR